jgi:hypothetical protein
VTVSLVAIAMPAGLRGAGAASLTAALAVPSAVVAVSVLQRAWEVSRAGGQPVPQPLLKRLVWPLAAGGSMLSLILAALGFLALAALMAAITVVNVVSARRLSRPHRS